MADLVLWRPAFFGVKPEIVLKGGFIAHAAMGDANASIPTPQPVLGRPMFGSMGKAVGSTSYSFVSKASFDTKDFQSELGLDKKIAPISNCRDIGKKDMVLNDYLPKIEVDPETYIVKADGEILTCEPSDKLPMAQRYFLF